MGLGLDGGWLTVPRDVIVPWKFAAAVANAVPATALTSTVASNGMRMDLRIS